MCWVGRGFAKIAAKDIVVYKLGHVIETTKEFLSLYQNYEYVPGIRNKTITLTPMKGLEHVSQLRKDELGVIYEGYHSYRDISLPFKGIKSDFRIIYLGKTREHIGIYNNYYVVTFIIPKGSQYYENDLGEIVSNNIIYTGKYVKL